MSSSWSRYFIIFPVHRVWLDVRGYTSSSPCTFSGVINQTVLWWQAGGPDRAGGPLMVLKCHICNCPMPYKLLDLDLFADTHRARDADTFWEWYRPLPTAFYFPEIFGRTLLISRRLIVMDCCMLVDECDNNRTRALRCVMCHIT